jgi:hypothetical protein
MCKVINARQVGKRPALMAALHELRGKKPRVLVRTRALSCGGAD